MGYSLTRMSYLPNSGSFNGFLSHDEDPARSIYRLSGKIKSQIDFECFTGHQ